MNKSLLTQKTFASYDPISSHGSKCDLTQLCHNLFEQQKIKWQQMAEGYSAFESIQVREIMCNGYSVKLQYNPKRIVNTTANVDPNVISKRRCFLCLEHLPEQQQGILYRNEFLILCNPSPIFFRHFTVSSIQHIPQELESYTNLMLDLAKNISPDYTVFYNGAKCGASAPDHLHFQASPRRAIQVECDAVDVGRRKSFYHKNHVAGYTLTNYGRAVVVIESTDKLLLFDFIQNMFAEWKTYLHLSEEPLMNILCSYQEDIWRLIIFPRCKHRPDVYFKNEEERVIISPAAVDIGGLIVTPLEKDFIRTDAKLIENIFSEVSEKQEAVEKILEILA